jgi:hypothetical protein
MTANPQIGARSVSHLFERHRFDQLKREWREIEEGILINDERQGWPDIQRVPSGN